MTVKQWWHNLKWFHVPIAAGITWAVMHLSELAIIMAVPNIGIGIAQIDFFLGIASWLGTSYLWYWFREAGLVMLFIANIRMSQIIEAGIRQATAWHRKHHWALWLIWPGTVTGLFVWNLLGDSLNRIPYRYLTVAGEGWLARNRPSNPFWFKRLFSKKPKAKVRPQRPAPRVSAAPGLRQFFKLGQGVVELHFTPRKKGVSDAELMAAWQRFQKTGRVPKGYRLHADIRLKSDGKVRSFAFPKAKLNKWLPTKLAGVIDSTKGHGTKLLKNTGKSIRKDAVITPEGYGRGISQVVDERPILTWKSEKGNLHFVWGDQVFALIPGKSNDQYMLIPKKEKLPSFRSVVKGRTFDFKDVSSNPSAVKELLASTEYVMEKKYPDHFHVMFVDKDGWVSLYSRRPSTRAGRETNRPINKSYHVPQITQVKIPKKYWDSELEVGLYMDKNLPAVQAEQLGAGILNSQPAVAVQKQAKVGQLKMKVFRFRKLGGQDTSGKAWYGPDGQRALIEKASSEIRPNGKLWAHVPKKYPAKLAARKSAWAKSKRAKDEGFVFKAINSLKAAKAKHFMTSERRVVGVQALESKLGKKGAGALILSDGSTCPIRQVGVPGIPNAEGMHLDAYRKLIWDNQKKVVGLLAEVEHEDTPKGQRLQSPKLRRLRRDY